MDVRQEYIKKLEKQNLDLRQKINSLQDELERVVGIVEEVQDMIYTIDVGIVDYISNTKKNKNGTYTIDSKSMNTIRGKEMGVGEDLDEMLFKIQQITGDRFNRDFT